MSSPCKAAALAVAALGLAGCGSAGKAPVAGEATGAAVQVYAAGSLREVLDRHCQRA